MDVKEYKNRLGDEYLRQRREIKKKRRLKDPALFHIQERIPMWKKRDAESDLTVEYLVKLWENQRGCCYYTGVPMTPGSKGSARLDSASLDKLDPDSGYRQGNVVWATHLANTSKGPRSEAGFYEFCRLVISQSRSRVESRSGEVVNEHVHF